MPILTLPHHGLTNSAARRCKHWIKQLDHVDTTQSNGYAFVGTFHNFEATVEAPDGTWFLSYIENASATRLNGRAVTVYQVRHAKLVEVEEWDLDANAGWALKVRDEIAALMQRTTSDDELRAERQQLLTRLAEINALLGDTTDTPTS
ncbi:hypothetical protein [Micromonospora aurantiaca (nom. illeg.)]|uniref:hypothetical protein n=1 Tax=Micromonospora aurantiaca (nom. illeg.) TaxID=47850 RepID=UPI0033D8BEEE